ncbi:MAG: dTDP-glucose 4,6-dehydratase [Candidatus Aenigmarchaeota archaeon]|nr:dTDP-glucose 4,6-dehydratase [Candidatus Aenigmarchaeota archaeon]
MPVKLLVTGGAGFMGSAFVRKMSEQQTDANASASYDVTVIDKLTYAGNKSNLSGTNHKFVKADISNKFVVEKLVKNSDIVVNYAAETHVDRSIKSGETFVKSNVLGTFMLLEAARKFSKKLIQISTDEVYGSVDNGRFRETDSLLPNSPYAASKASADLLVRSFIKTYDLDAKIVRSCNVFGHHQYPEKFIPRSITNIIEGRKLQIYGDGKNIREWVHVDDHASAINFIINNDFNGGNVVNIGTGNEKKNIEIAKLVLENFGLGLDMIEFVKDRPGHDFRYAMDWNLLRRKGWRPSTNFNEALSATIEWYRENKKWWKPLLKYS